MLGSSRSVSLLLMGDETVAEMRISHVCRNSRPVGAMRPLWRGSFAIIWPMLMLISPAKTLDLTTPIPAELPSSSRPQFLNRAQELIQTLRGLTAADIAALMELSEALSELNAQRYASWRPRHTQRNSRPALFTFNGDVYEGLAARTLPPAAIERAQEQLLILSGLYGLLRPLDLIQAHRLEMGTALATDAGRNLYAYWGDSVAAAVQKRLRGQSPRVVVNLASHEYARAALRPALKARVVECVFEDWSGGEYKVVSFFAKRARGLMVRHVLLNAIDSPEGLDSFDAEGYALASDQSSADRRVFRRRVEPVGNR